MTVLKVIGLTICWWMGTAAMIGAAKQGPVTWQAVASTLFIFATAAVISQSKP